MPLEKEKQVTSDQLEEVQPMIGEYKGNLIIRIPTADSANPENTSH